MGVPVRLTVHDISGRQVASVLDAAVGRPVVPGAISEYGWNPGGLPSGVYFARLAIGGSVSETKLVYVK